MKTNRKLALALLVGAVTSRRVLFAASLLMSLPIPLTANAEQYGPPKLGLNILYKISEVPLVPARYARIITSNVDGDRAQLTRSAWQGPASGSGPINQVWIRHGYGGPGARCTNIVDASTFKTIEIGSIVTYTGWCEVEDYTSVSQTTRRVVSRQSLTTEAGSFDTILMESTTKTDHSDREPPPSPGELNGTDQFFNGCGVGTALKK